MSAEDLLRGCEEAHMQLTAGWLDQGRETLGRAMDAYLQTRTHDQGAAWHVEEIDDWQPGEPQWTLTGGPESCPGADFLMKPDADWWRDYLNALASPAPDTQGSEGQWAAMEPVFQMALESLPPPAHEGACTPETMCDMDCSDRYYGFELIGKARAALAAAPALAAEEGE